MPPVAVRLTIPNRTMFECRGIVGRAGRVVEASDTGPKMFGGPGTIERATVYQAIRDGLSAGFEVVSKGVTDDLGDRNAVMFGAACEAFLEFRV